MVLHTKQRCHYKNDIWEVKMINDNILLFIISIVLIYAFDHKILPTLGIVVLDLIQIYFVVVISTSITQADALYAFLYIVSMLYGMFMLLVGSTETTENNKELIL